MPEKDVSIAGENEMSGAIRPAKDEEFTFSDPYDHHVSLVSF
jgi:hypothetical protein